MMNEKQIITCGPCYHGPLFFLHQLLRFFLLLMLHHSDKLAIPHGHLFLLLHILHLVLFKFLYSRGELSISGDSHVVFLWDIDSNSRLSFLRIADLSFVWNGFVVIYFLQLVSKSCPPRAATMRQGLRFYWWQVNTFQDIGMCH